MTYIFVYFIPGAAGNFMSRCLNLLDNSYCWTLDPQLPLDIDDKIAILGYEKNKPRDWIQFEHTLKHYSEFRAHSDLPNNAKSVWLQHPNYDMIERSLVNEKDKSVIFYINPQNCFDWCLANALYKNTWIDAKWIEAGHDISQRHDVINLDLNKIKTSWDTFIIEFQTVLDSIAHKLSSVELAALQNLYHQWHKTILKSEDIADFKFKLGWYNT